MREQPETIPVNLQNFEIYFLSLLRWLKILYQQFSFFQKSLTSFFFLNSKDSVTDSNLLLIKFSIQLISIKSKGVILKWTYFIFEIFQDRKKLRLLQDMTCTTTAGYKTSLKSGGCWWVQPRLKTRCSVTTVPLCKGVREQLILNRLTYGLPTFGFAGATIWWFKLFFFTKCRYTFIRIYFNEYLSSEKLTSNHFYRKFKKKNFCLNNFSYSFLVQKLFAKI